MLRLVAAPNGKNLNCCLDDAPLRLPPDARSAIRLISVDDIPLAVSARREHGWHRPNGFYIRHQNDPGWVISAILPACQLAEFMNSLPHVAR